RRPNKYSYHLCEQEDMTHVTGRWAGFTARLRVIIILPKPMESALVPDIPGRTHGEDAFIAAGQEHPFQKPGALVVEKVFVPLVLHQFGYDHDDVASGMFL